jgi:isoamylase
MTPGAPRGRRGIEILPGRPHPLGATVQGDGVNFSVFSAHATSVQLLLFDHFDQPLPTHVITLNPQRNKTFYYWHVFVRGVGDGQIYGYRVDGPYQPEEGLRFAPSKVLLDPYARGVIYGANWSRADAVGFQDNTASALKSVVVDLRGYDWQGDEPLQRPMHETVIYETHVRSLTAHPSSGVAHPGTFAGLVEKIPYLYSLGITAVELLPVQQFDEQEFLHVNPLTGERLSNYWGYAPLAYFAPHLRYATDSRDAARAARRAVDEFRDMVKALHRAGIEVILDVVYNHTGEGDHLGPTICFRGLENTAYYMLEPDRQFYLNFSGTGNTVNCNHSIVRRLIRESLRYWVQEFHVDGFRFDLASVLSRNERGEPMEDAPILWEIESDPVLAGTKLIAEAWDAAGLYQQGSFTGDRWAEWNGHFRDDLRRFVRGDRDTVRHLAWCMTGSFDVFRHKPSYASHRSINFVTCHDGFTLHDLVSYNRKHNEANGQNNSDGTPHNLSWNCGVEGPTDDPEILALRRRQMRNFIALLMTARGTPMLLGGDEMARTQGGNNNAYCQDNPVSWYDWGLVEENADFVRFVREMIAFRRRHPTLTTDHSLDGRSYEAALTDRVTFHGVRQVQPDWSHHSHSLAIHFHAVPGDVGIYIIANAFWGSLTFELPPAIRWRRVVDTYLPPPHDIIDEDEAELLSEPLYTVAPRSVLILVEARHP